MNAPWSAITPVGAPVHVDPEEFRRIAGRLIEASKPGEGVFLAMGQRLDSAIQVIGRLTSGLQDLSATIDGEQVQAAAEGLRGAADRVIDLVGLLAAEGDALTGLGGMVDRGSPAIGLLRKTVSELTILGLNAKIQMGQMPGATSDFAIFTSEISRLANLAGQDLEELGRGYGGISALIDRARSGQQEFLRMHGTALGEVGQRLRQSLDVLDAHHHQTNAVIDSICRRSKDIGGLIGGAVVALQGNDITRQRVEHVAEALQKAAAIVDADCGEGGLEALGLPERAQVAAIICRLQARQLSKAADDFEGEMRGLVANLTQLAADARDMVSQETSLGGASGDGRESLFFRLREELAQARDLYARFDGARAGTHALIGDVSAGVGRLISHVDAVHDIEADIRVMGLNATLKCGRLGADGKALAVIAQELRQCAHRTEEQARAVGEGLQALVSAAEDLAGLARGHDGAAPVVEVMSQSLDRLVEAQGVFERMLPRMGDDARLVDEILREAAEGANFHTVLAPELRNVAGELEKLSAALAITEGDEQALAQRALGLLDGHYTMASERDIHALFLTGGEGVADADGVDDFDADILF